jgi:hypothetical protein
MRRFVFRVSYRVDFAQGIDIFREDIKTSRSAHLIYLLAIFLILFQIQYKWGFGVLGSNT